MDFNTFIFTMCVPFHPFQTEPYLMLKKNPSSDGGKPLVGIDRYEGYCADLVKKIAEIINIEYLLIPVKDGKYGAKDENGSWNGMVGELVRNVSPSHKPVVGKCQEFVWDVFFSL